MSFLFYLLGISSGSKILDAILLLFLGILSTLCGTYAFTTCRFQLAMRDGVSRGKRVEPPTLPYWIPYIGNMFSMANLHGLYDEAA